MLTTATTGMDGRVRIGSPTAGPNTRWPSFLAPPARYVTLRDPGPDDEPCPEANAPPSRGSAGLATVAATVHSARWCSARRRRQGTCPGAAPLRAFGVSDRGMLGTDARPRVFDAASDLGGQGARPVAVAVRAAANTHAQLVGKTRLLTPPLTMLVGGCASWRVRSQEDILGGSTLYVRGLAMRALARPVR